MLLPQHQAICFPALTYTWVMCLTETTVNPKVNYVLKAEFFLRISGVFLFFYRGAGKNILWSITEGTHKVCVYLAQIQSPF